MGKKQTNTDPNMSPIYESLNVWVEVPPEQRPTREELGHLIPDMGEAVFDPATPLYRSIPAREWAGEPLA